MVYKRKKYHYGDTHLKKKWRTKRRTKDLDEIDKDIKPENAEKLLKQEVDYDKPGSAQFYCVHCARYFINNQALQEHFKTKVHKRRLKALELEPYTIEESERAAGFGNWKTAEKRKIETLNPQLNTSDDEVSNFDEQIKNKSDLIKNIEARKLDIDLDKIEKRWNFFKMIDDHKNILEVTRTEIFNLINKLKEDPEQNKADIEKLLLHSKLVKDDLKNIKDYSYGIEENANLGVLGLPNILHSKTPIDHEIIEHEFLSRPNDPTPSHVEIGKSQNLIEFTNPLFYFLKSEASLFDFTISNYFQKCLLDFGHIQFSNADFARSVVVEGCGANYLDKSKIFTLENLDSEKSQELNRLHIVGGASLYSFMAYFTRHSIQSSYLPLKLFAMGRIYKPVIEKPLDLFNLGQQSVIQVFVAVDDDDQKMDDILNNMKRQIIEIYEPLGYHFKLVYVPAYDLEITESLRLSIQMFSNHLQKYIEVGNLSVYDNYLSKRLLFTCNVNKEKKFVKVVGGQLLNVPKFLGCALENNYSNQCPLLNDLLQKYL